MRLKIRALLFILSFQLQVARGVEVLKSLLKLILSESSSSNKQPGYDGSSAMVTKDHKSYHGEDMMIIGAGYSRTGTDSLKTALTKLGYKTYHGQRVMTEQDHLYFWKRYFLDDDDTIFSMIRNEGYNATTDYPGCLVFDKYMSLYPNAKVILSLHPRGSYAWAESYSKTLVRLETVARKAPLKFLKSLSKDYPLFKDATRERMGLDPDNYQPSIESLVESYEKWVLHVKETVPQSKLLIHKASDGYEPIIKFLELSTERSISMIDEEYPQVNDSKELSQQIEHFEQLAYWWSSILAVSIIVVIVVLKLIVVDYCWKKKIRHEQNPKKFS